MASSGLELGAEPVGVRDQVLAQVRDERGPVARLPHRVQPERDLSEPEVTVEAVRATPPSTSTSGSLDAERLGADLPVLTEPAPLGSLVPEVWAPGSQTFQGAGGRCCT